MPSKLKQYPILFTLGKCSFRFVTSLRYLVGMASCFRKEFFSSCKNVWCIPDSQSTTAQSVRFTVLGKTSDRTTLHTDPIFSCFAASSSNTPGRHCRKMQETNFFSETYKLKTGTCIYLHVRVFDLRSKQSLPPLTSQKG